MTKYYVLLLIFLIFLTNLVAQSAIPVNPSIHTEKKEADWGLGGHPIIGYDDEVGLTLGGACVIYFEPESKNQDLDEIEINSTVNQSKQSDLMVVYSKYLQDNTWNINGEFGYKNYPDDYQDKDYDAVYIPFELEAMYKIRENLYLGSAYKFEYSKIKFEDSSFKDILGAGRMVLSGLGGKFVYKNMPKGQLYRRKGNILEVSGTYYSHVLGSSEEFGGVSLDYRHYQPVLSRCVLAYQIALKTKFGDIPFTGLSSLENKSILRGGDNRTGKHFGAGQVEFRFPVYGRIGGAVFMGVGEVEDRVRDFGTDVCFAGGIGPRITLNRKKDITVRFDFAFNTEGEKSIYIKIKEAF